MTTEYFSANESKMITVDVVLHGGMERSTWLIAALQTYVSEVCDEYFKCNIRLQQIGNEEAHNGNFDTPLWIITGPCVGSRLENWITPDYKNNLSEFTNKRGEYRFVWLIDARRFCFVALITILLEHVSLLIAQRGASLIGSIIDSNFVPVGVVNSVWIGYKDPSIRLKLEGAITSKKSMTEPSIIKLVTSLKK